MNAMFIFAFVVLLVMLVLLGFLIANVVYYNKIKNGTNLSQGQANSLFILNVIGLIIVVFIFFYAIFAAIRSRSYSVATTVTTVSDDGTTVETTTTQVPTTTAPVVTAAPAVVPAPVPVVAPAPAAAPVALGRIPDNAIKIGSVPAGKTLYRLNATQTVPAGTVCAF